MAYVTVPKDLTRVKSKIVFGLTKRQLICFGGALLVGVPLYFLLRGRVTGSAAALIMVFAMLPGFLLALYERHGQPLEVVVWQIVQCCFIDVYKRQAVCAAVRPFHPFAEERLAGQRGADIHCLPHSRDSGNAG